MSHGYGRDRAHEDGHVNGRESYRESAHVNDRGCDHDHVHACVRVHANAPCCDRAGASCRLHGHAIHQDQICHGRAGLR